MAAEYHTNDDELGALLHRLLIVEGEAEVEIMHPIEGQMIVTQASYQKLIDNLARLKAMSPAERIKETKRIANKRDVQFCASMIAAEIYTVDIDDEDSFGLDVDGKEVPMEAMIFLPVESYPKKIAATETELGCFVDETMRKPPVRIQQKI